MTFKIERNTGEITIGVEIVDPNAEITVDLVFCSQSRSKRITLN